MRTASIQNEKGKVIFEQRNVEVPKDWTQTATNIVASKYFHGKLGTPERESSVRQLIGRVADYIAQWGVEGGYFRGEDDAKSFHDELTHILVRQKAAFNSPVWFNCGLWHKYHRSSHASGWYWDPATGGTKKETEAYRHPQCSACFINSVQDNLESILNLAKVEGMLLSGGGDGDPDPLSLSRSSVRGGEGWVTRGRTPLEEHPFGLGQGQDAFQVIWTELMKQAEHCGYGKPRSPSWSRP